MEQILVLLGLATLAVPVLLVVALVSIGNLKRRVAALEEALARRGSPVPGDAGTGSASATAAAPAAVQRRSEAARGPRAPPRAEREQALPERFSPSGVAPARRMPAAAPAEAATPPPAARRTPAVPDAFGVLARAVKRWFSVGNVPVKVGMLVLLAGVAALLKYASDQGWLRLPMELRLAGVALAALAGLVFGWRQRRRRPAFALALQGGAIGMLLLVVFAAFKLLALPAGVAFGLTVLLIAGGGAMAVLQDSRTLAVLAVLAGFLAPIWLSTGSGDHVALFSYYAILNAAIFGIAWVKAWRVLNLIGFAFTWGIGLLWGVLSYTPDKLGSTQPFLLLFFVFYLPIPLLHARRRPPGRRDLVDGCLVFGTPLVAFSLQAALLEGARLPLAFCALGVAVLYAALGWWLRRRGGFAVLQQSYALLAVGFATLAVPLALSARATAAVFALEGAALVWLGLRQGRALPQWAGAGLQLAAAFAYAVGVPMLFAGAHPIVNAGFMGALLIALAGFASAWAYHAKGLARGALPGYLWGLAWWCGALLHEIVAFLGADARADALLVATAATGWLAAEAHRLRPARTLSATTLLTLALAIPLAFAQADAHGHPFAGHGGMAWLAFAGLGVRSLFCLRTDGGRAGDLAQCAWWLVWPVALSLSATWVAQRIGLAQGWLWATAALPWATLAAASILRWGWLAAPRGAGFDVFRRPLQLVVFAVLAAWWVLGQSTSGESAPLPWLPLLNPLELMQLVAIALAVRWLRTPQAPALATGVRTGLLPVLGLALATASTLRTVHHWGGLPWDAALLSSSLAQTSLTVVWSLLGVAGWIAGSRRGRRGLWLAGAVLMGVVLAKLVLVDRQHLGDLLGIGSFIAYGLLCTAIGWFAPAPPRPGNERKETT